MTENNKAEMLVKLLKDRKLRITAAESCTGGLLMSKITSVSGASNVFDGGFVTYSAEVKCRTVGVKKSTVKKYGVVSEQTASEMANGARIAMKADVALSITGWAGPYDGDDGQPHGTVCIGYSDGVKNKAVKYRFDGGREEVRNKAAEQAIVMALTELDNS